MFFNSIEFALFLPTVFILYWFVTNKKLVLQNLLLLAASYFFYGCWDWRFLGLILFSSIVDYSIGIALHKATHAQKRKWLLAASIFVNIGLLMFFKYYNFFIDSFINSFSLFGTKLNISSMRIILPVGISFYTFQTLSYSIDVYRRKIEPTRNIVSFLAFVSFFPQLVAGPIERATNLLPQFYKKRVFNYHKAVDGLRQILWGLFKKIVIADTCAFYADLIFKNHEDHSGSTLIVGAFFFSFQIYCDFSGYSDIAIGSSRLFGFNLKQNFAFPYFSRNIAEFWRRWHISLTSWFKDYVYIPLGGNRGNNWKKIRNVFIIFVISGFWHGGKWTFIIWGALNALLFIPLIVTKSKRNYEGVIAEGKLIPDFRSFLMMISTFCLTLFLWIFFRSRDMTQAMGFFTEIFSESLFTIPAIRPSLVLLLIAIFVLIEWFGRADKYAIEKNILKWKKVPRHMLYYGLVFMIYYFIYQGGQKQFIYFQF